MLFLECIVHGWIQLKSFGAHFVVLSVSRMCEMVLPYPALSGSSVSSTDNCVTSPSYTSLRSEIRNPIEARSAVDYFAYSVSDTDRRKTQHSSVDYLPLWLYWNSTVVEQLA